MSALKQGSTAKDNKSERNLLDEKSINFKITETKICFCDNYRMEHRNIILQSCSSFTVFHYLLFFAAYVICKKTYSFSRVVFFQTKIAISFYSKTNINDSSRVRTTRFSSSRLRVRVSVMPNNFTIYLQHFRYPNNETLKDSPTKFSGTVRQKIFDVKSWYSPTLLLSINFFATENFLKHSTDGFPYEVFRYCETKKFNWKLWHNPLKHKIFRYPKLVRHKRVPLKKILSLWDKKFWQKIVILPPSPLPLIHKIFRYKKFCEAQKGSSTKVFGNVRQKFFNGKSWYLSA